MEQLFGSKTRVKLLKLFLTNPNRAFYVREITRKIDEQINSVRRELANLLSIGILTSKEQNNRLYYEVAQGYKHYASLRSIFAGVSSKEDGITTTVADKSTSTSLKGLGAVDVLAYMGSFTGDNKTSVDVLIVGDVNKTRVNNYIADLEDEEGREIAYVVLTKDDLAYRRQVNDRFIGLVDQAKKTVLHDPSGLMSKHKIKGDKK